MTRLNCEENLTKLPSKSMYYYYYYGERKRNGISFWAFFLSILVYISIFYVFNLSPSALFNTTKFWFFISNTLILIIAADFGAFSSSRKNDYYYYEEYVKNSQVRTNHIPAPSEFLHHVNVKVQEQKHDEQPQEKIKDVVVYDHQDDDESHEKKLEMIVKHKPENPNKNQEDESSERVGITPESTEVHCDDEQVVKEKKSETKCMRSKSEKIVLELDPELDEKKIQRSQSERYDYGKAVKKEEEEEEEEEENDFSTMSDEELNRRVEEFIRNFNREIRLQAIRNRQNMYAHEV